VGGGGGGGGGIRNRNVSFYICVTGKVDGRIILKWIYFNVLLTVHRDISTQ